MSKNLVLWIVLGGSGLFVLSCGGCCVLLALLPSRPMTPTANNNPAGGGGNPLLFNPPKSKSDARLKKVAQTDVIDGMKASAWVRLFRDRNPEVHRQAYSALLRLNDQAAPLIVDLLLDDPNDSIREEAVDWLNSAGRADALPALDWTVANTKDAQLRQRAADVAAVLRKKMEDLIKSP